MIHLRTCPNLLFVLGKRYSRFANVWPMWPVAGTSGANVPLKLSCLTSLYPRSERLLFLDFDVVVFQCDHECNVSSCCLVPVRRIFHSLLGSHFPCFSRSESVGPSSLSGVLFWIDVCGRLDRHTAGGLALSSLASLGADTARRF